MGEPIPRSRMDEKQRGEWEAYKLACIEYAKVLPDTCACSIVRRVFRDLTDRRSIKHVLEQVDWVVGWEMLQDLRDSVHEALDLEEGP